MNVRQDLKIQRTALAYIRQHAMDVGEWRYTRLAERHAELSGAFELEDGELPIVCCFISEASWYCFTTRRVAGSFGGSYVQAPATGLSAADFPDFKGYGNQRTGIMRLGFSDDSRVQLEFETGKASMAPIYAVRFWRIKYPVLDTLEG